MNTPTSSTPLIEVLGGYEASFATASEVLVSEHARHAALCDWIDSDWRDLEGDARRRDARHLFDILTGELPQHELDEHEELFPVLIERCLPDDDIERVLARLANDHAFDDELIAFIIDDLTALAEGRETPNPQRLAINLAGFARNLSRHVAWENETVLPLAETRLSVADQAQIAERMMRRRSSSGRDSAQETRAQERT